MTPVSTSGTCSTCEGEGQVARGFAIDAPGRPEIVPCPKCCCTTCGTPYEAADGGCYACNEWDPAS